MWLVHAAVDWADGDRLFDAGSTRRRDSYLDILVELADRAESTP